MPVASTSDTGQRSIFKTSTKSFCVGDFFCSIAINLTYSFMMLLPVFIAVFLGKAASQAVPAQALVVDPKSFLALDTVLPPSESNFTNVCQHKKPWFEPFAKSLPAIYPARYHRGRSCRKTFPHLRQCLLQDYWLQSHPLHNRQE